MKRKKLSILLAGGGIACSQLAGFEDFKALEVSGGAPGDAGASAMTSAEAGVPGAAGRAGGAAFGGYGGASGGAVNVGSSGTNIGAGDGGSAPSTGGKVGAAGSVGVAGSSGSAGSGGTTSGGGRGGTTSVAGSAGTGAIGSCGNQLLLNADFEQGRTLWIETTTWPGLVVIVPQNDAKLVAESVTPQAGNFLAWLGGVPDDMFDSHTVTLSQDVVIPPDAASLTLTGYVWVKTAEVDNLADYDDLYLEFMYPNGDLAWQAKHYSNRTPTSGWVTIDNATTNNSALRGQTLTFMANAYTDPELKTSFWIDSLRLVAQCGR